MLHHPSFELTDGSQFDIPKPVRRGILHDLLLESDTDAGLVRSRMATERQLDYLMGESEQPYDTFDWTVLNTQSCNDQDREIIRLILEIIQPHYPQANLLTNGRITLKDDPYFYLEYFDGKLLVYREHFNGAWPASMASGAVSLADPDFAQKLLTLLRSVLPC